MKVALRRLAKKAGAGSGLTDSSLRKADVLAGPDRRIAVNPAPLTVASTSTLGVAQALSGLAAESPSLAAAAAGPGTMVVEAFEVS